MPATRLLANPSVKAPISDAASCAAKANPQITAAANKRERDMYFFLFIKFSVFLFKFILTLERLKCQEKWMILLKKYWKAIL